MSKTQFHMCQSVEGPVRRFTKRDWNRMAKFCTTDDDKKMTGEQVRLYFLECHAKGWKVIPLGKPCKGFDYQTGCPGHPIADEEAAK